MSDEIPPRLASGPLSPARPVMIFDGACDFCRFWVARWSRSAAGRIECRPSTDAAPDFPGIAPGEFRRAVQFVEPDGTVTSGAEAVFRAAGYSRGSFHLLSRLPILLPAARVAYRFIAKNRGVFSFFTRLFFGKEACPPTYLISRSLFFRLLGLAYALAFASLGMQVLGLMGRRGISPAADFLKAVREQIGPARYRLLPTLFWFGAGDDALVAGCVAGAVLGCAAAVGFCPVLCLSLLWILYLSFVTVGRDFLGFQWDALLLEAGFIAVFAAPWQLWPDWKSETRAQRVARWLLLWLAFRLTFESGVVKLASGDPTWHNLTALEYHYETQPLPLWTAWYANQAPAWFQKFSCFAVLAIELAAPFFIFAPRNARRAGALAMIGLQALIAATGNYAFFNLLSVALYLLLLDDAFWPRLLRDRSHRGQPQKQRWAWPLPVVAPLAAGQFLLTTFLLLDLLRIRVPGADAIRDAARTAAPFSIANRYGLFAVMTTTRPEIIVEGSRNGVIWLPYQFKYKAGNLAGRPRLIAPFQPRLDWQMWFAALGSFDQSPWFAGFAARLLEGSPDVLALLASNPFPNVPPRYVKASLYQYHFTRFGDHTRDWWKREYDSQYCPVLSLRSDAAQ